MPSRHDELMLANGNESRKSWTPFTPSDVTAQVTGLIATNTANNVCNITPETKIQLTAENYIVDFVSTSSIQHFNMGETNITKLQKTLTEKSWIMYSSWGRTNIPYSRKNKDFRNLLTTPESHALMHLFPKIFKNFMEQQNTSGRSLLSISCSSSDHFAHNVDAKFVRISVRAFELKKFCTESSTSCTEVGNMPTSSDSKPSMLRRTHSL